MSILDSFYAQNLSHAPAGYKFRDGSTVGVSSTGRLIIRPPDYGAQNAGNAGSGNASGGGGSINMPDAANQFGPWADPAASTTRESSQEILSAFLNAYPQLAKALTEQMGEEERAKLNIQKETAPQYAQLESDLYSKYAPSFQAVTEQLARQADPEFYKLRGETADKTSQLVGGLDPNKLSGGERAELERAVNSGAVRSGNLGVNSAIETAGNAMHFGQALNQKRASIGNILSSVTSGLQNFRSGTAPSPYNFQPLKAITSDPSQAGTNIFGNLTGVRAQENQINADRRDSLDRYHEGINAQAGLLQANAAMGNSLANQRQVTNNTPIYAFSPTQGFYKL